MQLDVSVVVIRKDALAADAFGAVMANGVQAKRRKGLKTGIVYDRAGRLSGLHTLNKKKEDKNKAKTKAKPFHRGHIFNKAERKETFKLVGVECDGDLMCCS